MVRRGRGSAARTKATPGGRDAAVNGFADPVEPGDEPGARTIGAMALKRWVARGPGRAADDEGDSPRTYGPFDEDDVADLPDDPSLPDRVDFGAVRVPVPRGGEVAVEPEDGRLQAVHVMLPVGRLSVSALAAPRSERLWPDLAAEIDESLREGGATVRSFTGEWGRELHARTGDATSLFVGVDGPRWMLYGVATGPTSAAAELDAALRAMLRGTVVVRGRSPYPVRTVLPLTVPDELPRPAIAPDRVPVPRVPAERVAAPARLALPAGPTVDDPTTVTTVSGVDTVPHGIPRALPTAAEDDRDAGRPAYRTASAGDRPHDAATDPAAGTGARPDVESGVSRTASRGLFRRKTERPERPSSRPTQRRVADLLAQAERDRATAARSGPVRPERPAARADEPADATAPDSRRSRPVPDGPPMSDGYRESNGYGSNGHSGPNGHGANGSWTNGFIPRELTHDLPPTNGATADAPSRDATGEHPSSPYTRSPYDSTANGSGYTSGGYDALPADAHLGAYPDGSYSGGSYSNGSYPGGSYPGGSSPDTAYTNGSSTSGSWLDEPSISGSYGGAGVEGPAPEGGEVGEIEATVWAALARGGSSPSTGLAADGSDDWTLPLPVVRPAPEPEPVRPPAYPNAHDDAPTQAPRSRRARREAEERAAGEGRTAGRWTPEPHASDGWTPGRTAAGAHTTDRPRHTSGQHEPEPAADEYAPRVTRRRSRHAEEGGDVGGTSGGHGDRARHRRPGY